jgi:sterol desaturase/sphingolipid hydroxylase (fatty acid hydroxylase superfamily)
MSEPAIRLFAFGSVLVALIVWELVSPRRQRPLSRRSRWPGNLALVVLNTVVVRLLFPLGVTGAALWAQGRGWGLFNAVEAPGWLAFVVSLLALDLFIYGQHVALHRVPVLWRLHRVHHADVDVDVTTGVRFHPLEIVLSTAIKAVLVVALGAPAVAVIAFEIVLNATSMFNHANVGIPVGVDRVLRRVLVTPDMHRIHHSVRREETDSNFGFNVPWWDRLFRTYRDQPKDGQLGAVLGLGVFREPGELRLDRVLLQPFRTV